MTPEERRRFIFETAAAITDQPDNVCLLTLRGQRKTRCGTTSLAALSAASAATPDTAGRRAFAVRVADDVVALDADSHELSRHALSVTQAARAAGLVPVVVTSGRPGGLHAFIRITDPHLRLRLETLARNGGVDVRTGGWMRPPLSPHPGGSSGELVEPSDPQTALHALRRPHGVPQPSPSVRQQDQPLPTLGGPRRPLSPRISRILDHGDGQPDRSVTLQRVVTAMVSASWSFDQAWETLTSPDAAGAAKLAEILHRRGEDAARRYLGVCWASALRFCGSRPSQHRPNHELDTALDRLQQAADSHRWSGPGGSNAWLVLHRMIEVARKARTLTPTVSERQLVELCSMQRTAIRGALERLITEGWITRLRKGSGPKASLWELNVPPREPQPLTHSREGKPGGVRSSGGIPREPHDAFSPRALGALGYRALRYLRAHRRATVSEMADALGVHPGHLGRVLRTRLGAVGLVERLGNGWWALLEVADEDACLDQAAQRFGTAGFLETTAARHRWERLLYRRSRSWAADLGWWEHWERRCDHLGTVAA